jgi:hypothetical protein
VILITSVLKGGQIRLPSFIAERFKTGEVVEINLGDVKKSDVKIKRERKN